VTLHLLCPVELVLFSVICPLFMKLGGGRIIYIYIRVVPDADFGPDSG